MKVCLNKCHLIKVVRYAQTPAGERIYGWIMALHKGEVGGVAGQLITLLAMLGMVYLGYSGVRGYLLRPKPKAGKRISEASAATAS